MRRGVDARRHAKQDRLDAAELRGDPLGLVELPQMVDDQEPRTGGDGGPDIGVRLVVAVDDEQLSGGACRERMCQLALRATSIPMPSSSRIRRRPTVGFALHPYAARAPPG